MNLNLNILKKEFSKNFLTLFSGTVFSQVIPIVASPIISRMYPPSEFGLLAIFTASLSLLVILTSFQYELAIVLPKDDIDAFHIMVLSGLLTIFISFIALLLILILGDKIGIFLGNPEINKWLFLFPISVFLLGYFKSLNLWATRYKQYKRIVIRQISQSFVQAVSKIILGLANFISGGLIIGTILGELTSTSSIAYNTVKNDRHNFYKIDFKRMYRLAKEYDQFPKYSCPHGFIDVFSKNGIVFLINYFFSATILGLFSFSNTILSKPLLLIGNNVRQIFYQKASETYNTNPTKLWPMTKKIIYYLSLSSIIIFAPILFLGPTIFEFIFGEKWYDAGIYAQYLAPWLMTNFVFSPISSIPIILKKQKEYFYLSTLNNILIPIILLTTFILGFNLTTSLGIVSLFVVCYSIFLFLWIKNICQKIRLF